MLRVIPVFTFEKKIAKIVGIRCAVKYIGRLGVLLLLGVGLDNIIVLTIYRDI